MNTFSFALFLRINNHFSQSLIYLVNALYFIYLMEASTAKAEGKRD